MINVNYDDCCIMVYFMQLLHYASFNRPQHVQLWFKYTCYINPIGVGTCTMYFHYIITNASAARNIMQCYFPKIHVVFLCTILQDAALIINCLGLHNDYNLQNEFIIPLLLQDKFNVIETLVSKSPEHQRQLVQFFDKISHRSFSLSSLIPENIRVSS